MYLQGRRMLARAAMPRGARIALFAALALLAAACGRGEDPTLLPDDAGPPPTIEGLQARANEATKALNEGRWLDFYEFKSPRSVQPRIPYGLPLVQLCTKEQFIFDTGTKVARLRALAGLYGDEPLKWEIVEVTTDKQNERVGLVRLDIFHEGTLVTDEFHDYLGEAADGARWVHIDGEWWVEPADWDEGCHKDRPFGV